MRRKKILEHWAEHFDSVLNWPSIINDGVIILLPNFLINISLSEHQSQAEVEKAIRRMSSGKAPDPKSILVEVNAASGPKLTRKLTELFQSMWDHEEIQFEFKNTLIVHLYK